jgi:hypothetical protein
MSRANFPLVSKTIHTDIVVPPAMLNKRVEEYIAYRIHFLYLHKCNDEGFIMEITKVHPIAGDKDCVASLSGDPNMICQVSFDCLMYIPVKQSQIVVRVTSKEPRLQLCIAQVECPSLLVSITNRSQRDDFEAIEIGDLVRVHIDDFRIMLNSPIRMVATFEGE